MGGIQLAIPAHMNPRHRHPPPLYVPNVHWTMCTGVVLTVHDAIWKSPAWLLCMRTICTLLCIEAARRCALGQYVSGLLSRGLRDTASSPSPNESMCKHGRQMQRAASWGIHERKSHEFDHDRNTRGTGFNTHTMYKLIADMNNDVGWLVST